MRLAQCSWSSLLNDRQRLITVVMMTEKHWEHFSHGADIGVRGVASSKDEAFEQAEKQYVVPPREGIVHK